MRNFKFFFAATIACAFSFALAQVSIRVNEVGYEKSGAKRAVVQSSAAISETGAELVDMQGGVVYPIALKAGETVSGWSGRNFKVADFSEFKTEGEYRIRVGAAQSQPFKIGEKILQKETGRFQVEFFYKMRNTDNGDRNLGIRGGGGTHNIYGGWNDATGDRGKHLSHLSYANYFNPQQIPFVAWALLHASELQPDAFSNDSVKDEAAWGADYLLRSLSSQNYFYMSVFDNWGWESPREICSWGYNFQTQTNGTRWNTYQSAMREGAGVSIAALARASKMGISGDSSSAQYLAGAIRAYEHLKANPTAYQDNGKENIIDDYCGLLAATELYNATGEQSYLQDAKVRANSLISRQSDEGWFYTHKDGGANARPFYHAADEGLPVVALARYVEICKPDNQSTAQNAIKKNLRWYIDISYGDPNPFEYAKMHGASASGAAPGAADLARGKTAAASRSEASYVASNAFDGSSATRWSSYQDGAENNNQWIAVDLGDVYKVDKVVLKWENAYGKNYNIDVSLDGISWTTVAEISNNASTDRTHAFAQTRSRHVRMFGIERALEYGGFSLYDFEVYGEAEQQAAPPKDARFFMPHNNETGYWWQGENARIASLSAAFAAGAPFADPSGQLWLDTLFGMATAQLDWILGKNPFGVTMMHGFGAENYPDYGAISPIPNIKGGICNGITAKDGNESDLDWFSDRSDAGVNWRWIEQWLPHNAWYLTAVASISSMIDNPRPQTGIKASYMAGAPLLDAIDAALAKGGSIEVYALHGKKLFSMNAKAGSSLAEIKRMHPEMPRGAYLLLIRDFSGKPAATGKALWQ